MAPFLGPFLDPTLRIWSSFKQKNNTIKIQSKVCSLLQLIFIDYEAQNDHRNPPKIFQKKKIKKTINYASEESHNIRSDALLMNRAWGLLPSVTKALISK